MTGLTRRDTLALAIGTGLVSPAGAASPAAESLHEIARSKGLRFGSAVAWSLPDADQGSFANPAYAALLERNCGLLVAENEMKWQWLRPSPTSFAFERFDAIVDYGQRHGMAVRGHNLLWHQPKWMPTWLNDHDFGPQPRVEAACILTSHIDTVLGRYGKRIGGYDVVNEAVRPADGQLYDTGLSRALGGAEATLDLAFRTARAAAPHAQLVYNDYMSWEPGNDMHRAGVLRLLEGFRRRGVPVDALGVQSHLITQGPDARGTAKMLESDWRRFLDAVTAMGYKLLITEFDVRDNNLPAEPAVRDAAVAAFARAYLDVTLSYPALTDILVWGMSDRYSWIDGFEPRADGSKRRPTLYDAAFKPKPLRHALAQALATTVKR